MNSNVVDCDDCDVVGDGERVVGHDGQRLWRRGRHGRRRV